jgi:WD40 repeat protein
MYDTHVVTGSADASVRKWDMATCECLDVYQGHASRVFSLVCSNNMIFSTSYDRTARAWRFDTSDLDDDEDPCLRVFHVSTFSST